MNKVEKLSTTRLVLLLLVAVVFLDSRLDPPLFNVTRCDKLLVHLHLHVICNYKCALH